MTVTKFAWYASPDSDLSMIDDCITMARVTGSVGDSQIVYKTITDPGTPRHEMEIERFCHVMREGHQPENFIYVKTV